MLAAAACSDAPHSDTKSVVADLEMSVTIAGAEPAAADAAAPAAAEPPPADAAVANGEGVGDHVVDAVLRITTSVYGGASRGGGGGAPGSAWGQCARV